MKEIFFKELSYKIMGVAFDVYNQLGPGLKEKYYQKGMASKFKQENINFIEQIPYKIKLDDDKLGSYVLDFNVENKIAVELKVDTRFRKEYIKQVYGYLQKSGLNLGIIVLFTKDEVRQFRVLNS